MKEQYEAPALEVVNLLGADVVCASGEGNNDKADNVIIIGGGNG